LFYINIINYIKIFIYFIFIIQPSEGDVGWDVFTLDYHVTQPLNTIITSSAMEKYRKLFHFLWRLKRVEHTLSVTWKRHSIRNCRLNGNYEITIILKFELNYN